MNAPQETNKYLCGECGESSSDGEGFYPYLKNKCKKCHYAYQKEYRRRNSGKRINKDKKYAIKKRYGISVEQYDEILDAQSERCAVCGSPARDSRHGCLYIDHDHKTKTVRGALCNGCNRAAGFLNDDPERAVALAEYLYLGMGIDLMRETIDRVGPSGIDSALTKMVEEEIERRNRGTG